MCEIRLHVYVTSRMLNLIVIIVVNVSRSCHENMWYLMSSTIMYITCGLLYDDFHHKLKKQNKLYLAILSFKEKEGKDLYCFVWSKLYMSNIIIHNNNTSTYMELYPQKSVVSSDPRECLFPAHHQCVLSMRCPLYWPTCRQILNVAEHLN